MYSQMRKHFEKTGKTSQQITFSLFRSYLKTGIIQIKDDISITSIAELLYSLFIWEFGNSLSKLKVSKTLKKDEKEYKVYNAPLSQKYKITDYSSKIYSNIEFQKLKTLFGECKQLLLFEYNESRSASQKKDKTIQQAKITKIDYKEKTIELLGMASATSIKKQNPIQDYFHTNPFYLTVNKNKYYYIRPTGYDPNSKKLTGVIDSDSEITKADIPLNSTATYADTFGVKYDLSANPKTKTGSTVLGKIGKKLKASSDIIGFTGDNNIFKTMAGSKLTGIAGDITDLAKVWFGSDPDTAKFQIGSDNLVRANILNMFRVYLSEIKNKSSLKNKDVKDVLTAMANEFNDFDNFIKWLFEVINFIMSEYYNDNPDTNDQNSVKKYFLARNFFQSSKLESINMSIYDFLEMIKLNEEEQSIDLNKTMNDPKAKEIIGIDNNKVVDDFIEYLVSIRTIK